MFIFFEKHMGKSIEWSDLGGRWLGLGEETSYSISRINLLFFAFSSLK